MTVWDRQAENCCQYLKKGSGIHVEGSLKMDTWDDKTSGEKRSKIKVLADRVQFLDRREAGERNHIDHAGQRETGDQQHDAMCHARQAAARARMIRSLAVSPGCATNDVASATGPVCRESRSCLCGGGRDAKAVPRGEKRVQGSSRWTIATISARAQGRK